MLLGDFAGCRLAGRHARARLGHGRPQSGVGHEKRRVSRSSAPHAMLIDAESGTILFEKNADQLMAPSSLAKLMTAEVVFNEIKQGRLALDSEFIVSEDAWRHGGAPSHTSSMFAPIHSRVRVQDLIYGMIVQSGNDACIALAEGIAGIGAQVRRDDDQAGARARPRQVLFHQCDRLARPGAGRDARASSPGSPSTSSRPIRSSIRSTARRSSPGTRSASSTAIRCSP